MDPLTLALEFGVLVWVAVILRRHGWRTTRPRLVWMMTIGALATNLLLYVSLFPMLKAEAASQNISEGVLFGFLVFRTVEWATLAHVFTRLALALGRRYVEIGDRTFGRIVYRS